MKLKRMGILFIVMLLVSTLFSPMAFATQPVKPSLVALGDSITYGFGLGDPSSPSSDAYPYLIGDGLFNVTNISFPGWTSEDLLNELQNQQSALQDANVITLNIGSNDLLQASNIIGVIQDPSLYNKEEIETNITLASQKLATNLELIFGTIRGVNTQAPILVYNFYNPIVIDPSHPLAQEIAELSEGILQVVNTMIGQQLGNTPGVEAYSSFSGNQLDYLLPHEIFIRDIHPNQTGHQVLANLANELLIPILVPSALDLAASTEEQTDGPVNINVTASWTSHRYEMASR